MDCFVDRNLKNCTCTYEPCPRKGRCCECVEYHRSSKEIPGCFFPKNAERTYNRSITYFLSTMQTGGKS